MSGVEIAVRGIGGVREAVWWWPSEEARWRVVAVRCCGLARQLAWCRAARLVAVMRSIVEQSRASAMRHVGMQQRRRSGRRLWWWCRSAMSCVCGGVCMLQGKAFTSLGWWQHPWTELSPLGVSWWIYNPTARCLWVKPYPALEWVMVVPYWRRALLGGVVFKDPARLWWLCLSTAHGIFTRCGLLRRVAGMKGVAYFMT
jgi:hypothetical protein